MKQSLLDRKGTALAPDFKVAYAIFRHKGYDASFEDFKAFRISWKAYHMALDAYSNRLQSQKDFPLGSIDHIRHKVRDADLIIKRRSGTYVVHFKMGCRVWKIGGAKICVFSKNCSKTAILQTIRKMEAKELLPA